MVALDEVEWIPRTNLPIEVAVLSDGPATGAHVRPVKLPAGFVVPDHAHTGDYHRREPDRNVEARLLGGRRDPHAAAGFLRLPAKRRDAWRRPHRSRRRLHHVVAVGRGGFRPAVERRVTAGAQGMDGAARWTT